MGKVVERIKLTSFLDPSKTAEVEAVVDTGATMLALPIDLVERLGLRKLREATVRYADNRKQQKGIHGVVTVEIQGRAGEFNVLAEESGSPSLIGQIVLEQLDLVVNPKTRRLSPNPESPDMPLIEMLAKE